MIEKKILISFDYELFLGSNSGSVEKCLIEPTEYISAILDKHSVRAVFFVDTLYLSRLKTEANNNEAALKDYNKILQQLNDLAKKGHYLYHHIHPHWLDAIYNINTNKWDLTNKSKFTLSQLTDEEIDFVFEQSEKMLIEAYAGLNRPILIGYRAGGLYAQPFQKYKEAFQKYRISIDSSVLKGAISNASSGEYNFNYLKCPQKDIYNFEDDLIQYDKSGSFVELTMKTLSMTGIIKILNGIYYRINITRPSWQKMGDGMASGNKISGNKVNTKLRSEETFSIELMNDFKNHIYLLEIKKLEFLNIISHPKMISKANIKSFDKLLRKLKKRYLIKTDIEQIIVSSIHKTT